jgi:phage antirepressor YoqD-like protein
VTVVHKLFGFIGIIIYYLTWIKCIKEWELYPDYLKTMEVTKMISDKLLKELIGNEPKVLLYFDKRIMDSHNCIDIKGLASILQIRDDKKVLGRNLLFKKLKKEGILNAYNSPYQRFIDVGYFTTIITRDGFTKTLVTPKRIEYLRKRLS